jgi:site-specific recombinase
MGFLIVFYNQISTLLDNQKTNNSGLNTIFRKLEHDTTHEELRFLIELVNYFRPKLPTKTPQISIQSLIDFLNENPELLEAFRTYLYLIFNSKKFKNILSDAGILQNTHFFQEIKKRTIAKILPYQPDKNTLEFILNQVFYSRKDYAWFSKIPMEEFLDLYEILNLDSIYDSKSDNSTIHELLQSMRLIMQRMSGRALETDVIKMIPEYENFDSPFEVLEKEFDVIEEIIISNQSYFLNSENIDYKQINIILIQCEDFVNQAYKNSAKYGISLNVNQSLLRIRQQIKRLKYIFPYLILDADEDKRTKSISFFLSLVKYNCMKNNVRKLINESTQLIAYEITQHTAKTGEHYITKGSKEYFKMLYSAIGGGVIVGILCVIKLLLSKVETSDFGHAMLYSLNYAIGFTAVYLLGYTLATKQPAMTAAALIQSIEKDQFNSKDQQYKSFANLFARLFRSQFIAFVGNVIFAFPVALLIIYGVDFAFGLSIPHEKWNHLLTDLSPIHSAAIFHAAIAGVFLFLSGIISGSVSNSNKHNKLYFRIQENPTLKMSFGKRKTAQIAQWFERRWAGVASNIWFGFFMGTTASIGIFLGLNLDIRHITFASGNLALGLYGNGFQISNSMLFWGIFGIGIIGFVNFIVSFLLSLFLAFRSRNIPTSDLRFLFKAVWNHFKAHPMLFFFPVRSKRN